MDPPGCGFRPTCPTAVRSLRHLARGPLLPRGIRGNWRQRGSLSVSSPGCPHQFCNISLPVPMKQGFLPLLVRHLGPKKHQPYDNTARLQQWPFSAVVMFPYHIFSTFQSNYLNLFLRRNSLPDIPVVATQSEIRSLLSLSLFYLLRVKKKLPVV